MKIAIVTGADGFIGSQLVCNLLKRDYYVVAVVKSLSNISRLSIGINSNIAIIECDLTNIAALSIIIKNKGIILKYTDYSLFYHLAWIGVVGEERYNYILQLENAKYSCEAVRVAWEIGCTKFIGTGSIMEDDCDISSNPIADSINPGYLHYCAAKCTAHTMGKALAAQLGIDFCWAKISNAYGELDLPQRFICATLTKMLKNQECKLSEAKHYYDFIYIDDLVNAICDIGEMGISGHSYYIGSGKPKVLKEYILTMYDIAKSSSILSFGMIKAQNKWMEPSYFSIEKLHEHTGFKCLISFENGIERTLDWIRTELKLSEWRQR